MSSHRNRLKLLKILFFVVSFLIRLGLGIALSVWFAPSQAADDLLMLQYAHFKAHFSYPNAYSLVKYMGYPVFLSFVRISGIPVTFWLSLLWFLAAVSGFLFSKRLFTDSKLFILPYCVYGYILFLPQAFESWCGTRLYRNSVICPICLILFFLMLIILADNVLSDNGENAAKKRGIVEHVLLGFVFSFAYYIKEDGAWLLACLILWMICIVVTGGYRAYKPLFSFIPLAVFLIVSLLYMGINHHYFGVFETNTRNGGEPGRFLKLVYSIDSSDRTGTVWAPEDAIRKAFDNSKTLSSKPELLEAIEKSEELNGNIFENPIKGDHLGWVLRNAISSCGLWQEWSDRDSLYSGERGMESFFLDVNEELSAAFKSGALKRTNNRLSILGSMGSKDTSEIIALYEPILKSYAGAVWLIEYVPGIAYEGVTPESTLYESILDAAEFVHVRSLTEDITENFSYRLALAIVKILFFVYRILNSFFFICLIVFLIYGIFRIRKLSKTLMFSWLCAGIFVGIGFVYVFFVSWFSSFLFEDGVHMIILNFYNIALPGITAVAYIFAVFGITDICFKRIKGRK